jgi:GNAT superfamily N-acetyltransferase
MNISVNECHLATVLPYRAIYLNELNAQCRYNACHERGWSDSYLLTIDDEAVGYGSVKGQEIRDRDTVFEFFVVPQHRQHATALFRELLATSQATYIECQSNDQLLSPLMYEHADAISSDTILFDDHRVTHHAIDSAMVRLKRDDDQIFTHYHEPIGEYVMELSNEIVATGGFMLYYNPPFADVYMEVLEDCRRRGFGAFLVQELKKHCYRAGRVPAARTGFLNAPSRLTLLSAGMRICGCMLLGHVTRL